MRRNLLIVLVTCCIVATACSSTSAPPNTGITGRALAGPMCPVMIEGQPCPDKPVQVTLTVLNSSGGKVTTFQTDSEGKFTVDLAPGVYTLQVERTEGVYFGGADQQVTVVEGQYTPVTVSVDTGIR
jgi:carboxypeptidase family protein